jgi:TonB family protein
MKSILLSLALHFGFYTLVFSSHKGRNNSEPIFFDLQTQARTESAHTSLKRKNRESSTSRLKNHPVQQTATAADSLNEEVEFAQSSNGGGPVSLNRLSGEHNPYNQLVHLIYRHRVYPEECLRLRQQGQVTLSFFINSDGQIQNIEVLKASEHKMLNQAAQATMRRVRLNSELQTLFNRSYTFTFEFVINNLSS